ncbi:MAG: dihydrofolate reductase family protein [Dehalococcoidia bacterium]|nr:dihydrofolate reductase family protein [Dehalococcoidia bacterium]
MADDTPRLVLGRPDYTALALPEPPEDRPYVISNMVMSLDGTVVVEGTERGLGSPVDQALMRELRVNVDMVMNGANTLRISGTSSRVSEHLVALRQSRGLSAHPIAAVLSTSGDLPLDRLFFTARDFEAVVFLADSAPADRRAAIEATGRKVVTVPADAPLPSMLRHMRHEQGARSLLVEGGPHLLGSLVAAGAVDEYFLTLGPVIVAADAALPATVAARPPSIEGLTHMQLVSAHAEPTTNELFLRYRRPS